VSANTSAGLVAALFAVDPVGLGGVALHSAAGDQRDAWLAHLKSLLPAQAPWRRVPLHINDDRLLGGLDLAATLQAGRPIAQRGLLAEADGGVVLLAMAERIAASTAASVAAALDAHEIAVERHGIGARSASRIGVVALDEGLEDEPLPGRLRERLAFHLNLDPLPAAQSNEVEGYSPADVAAARLRLVAVRLTDDVIEALCAASIALGIDSVRAPLLACSAARAAAALEGTEATTAAHASLAAALVLAPRATQVPAAPEPELEPGSTEPRTEPEPEPEPEPGSNDSEAASPPETKPETDSANPPDADADTADTPETPETPQTPTGAVDDVVLEAALAAIPPGLLALLSLASQKSPRGAAAGRAGAAQIGQSRGRPTGVRRGEPQGGARLNLIETLRAAAPWQALRRRERAQGGHASTSQIEVRREDFHVWRFKQRSETTTVFVVDASGSAALHRLAETKGAVELLLADCYVRRDSVAVIAFRGAAAEVLLPPTRSLVRAKRSLAGLPGGGGTPLAAGIAAAHLLAAAVRRRGATPVVVLLTDGRANIARDGTPGRARAGNDAMAASHQMRLEGFATLVLDTSPQAQEPARQLATALGARYLPLPHAGAELLSQAVRAAGAGATEPR
jgi:magnesium chelatase subunit D